MDTNDRKQAVNFSDVVERNGRTVRQNNMEVQHVIPLGALVEVGCRGVPEWDGCRLYVVKHCRDCDGTPLYALGRKGEDNPMRMTCNGWSAESLTVVEGPNDTTFGDLEVGDLFIGFPVTDRNGTKTAAILMRKTSHGIDSRAENAETYGRVAFGCFRDDSRVVKVAKEL